MVSRERILDAAARVYAKHGFKGATTRLIAIEAGVNEVTLFRTFGSKGALLEAVLIQHVSKLDAPSLPAEPTDPRREIAAFIEGNLRKIAEMRPLLIHSMSELEDRPEAHEFACRGRSQVHGIIATYIRQLQEKDLADAATDPNVAALMLTGTVISDVMGRAIVPEIYPPQDGIVEQYTTLFLRAIGFRDTIDAPEETPATETAGAAPSVRSAVVRTSNTPSDIHS
jgi:AcrR family transcriptional regulator